MQGRVAFLSVLVYGWDAAPAEMSARAGLKQATLNTTFSNGMTRCSEMQEKGKFKPCSV